MKTLARIALSLSLFMVAGCTSLPSDLKTAIDTVRSATTAVSPEAIVLARQTFNGAEVIATRYMRLRRCTGSNGPLCRDPSLRERIDQAVLAGRAARNTLAQFQRGHPTGQGPEDAYATMVAATYTIKSLTQAYRAATGQ